MLSDSDFEVLKVRASIAPRSSDWPKPDYSQASIKGDKPTLGNAEGPVHWIHLHNAVADVRTRALKAVGAQSGVEADRSLSPTGKAEKKRALAEAALADLEKSVALTKARSSVEKQIARWNKELAPVHVDPVIAAEIRKHVAGLPAVDRLAFAIKHIGEVGPAILAAPGFLSGLEPGEVEIARRAYEAKVNSKVAAAKAQALDALQHLEAGYQNATRTVRERAGLGNTQHNGNGNGASAA